MTDDPLPYASGDVMQNVRDLTAAMDRHREEHGPFLRELRCSRLVLDHLLETLPKADTKPWGMSLSSVPLSLDTAVPLGHLRLVYDDGTTRDVEVLRIEIDTDWAFTIPFPSSEGRG